MTLKEVLNLTRRAVQTAGRSVCLIRRSIMNLSSCIFSVFEALWLLFFATKTLRLNVSLSKSINLGMKEIDVFLFVFEEFKPPDA